MTGVTLTGAWMTPSTIVAVEIAGLDCGDFSIAADGTITVPWGSDPDGLLTPAYLNAVSSKDAFNPALSKIEVSDGTETLTVYVPVLMGYSYASAGKTLRTLRSPTGGTLGETRRAHWIGVLFQSAQGVSLGGSSLLQVTFTDQAGNANTSDILFSGAFATPIDDDYGFDGTISWQITRPYPCTVVSVNTFIETQER